ncbi:hypothetical protein [Nocardioides sp.]|uniref:hypothetical protein n=1 Tax=Nocardioides sp. TaxID=35761 RepID=UPI0031FE7A79|nr:hypothetical protein [Nocardioides sp.]
MSPPAKRRVYLHIGAPKTGTTYLQDRLTINAKTLADNGVHFPTRSPLVSPALFQFRAALDLLDEDWGGAPGHAEGSWDALVRRVRRRTGTVIVSHEILAAAPADRVARAKSELGAGDAEIHVVYSTRDLGRQVPAAWQESVKQGRRWSYRRFLRGSESGKSWFHRAFDLPTVLNTWAAGLPPERVHVVTVPQPVTVGSQDPEVLWRRFCEVFGIDPAWAPRESDRTNPSLGAAETQLLRKLNRRMDRATRRKAAYDELIRGILAQQELVGRDSGAVRLPPEMYPWAQEQAERWIEWAQASGVHVVGDLEELRPVPPPDDEPFRHPDKVPAKQQLSAALDALAAMTREAARRPDPEQTLVRRVRTQAERLRDQ